MAEMKLSIQLSKNVESIQEAQTLFDIVKAYMEQYPQVYVRGSASIRFPEQEEVPDDG